MMKPEPPATCLRSSSSSGARFPRGLRCPFGLGKKNSKGSPPKGLLLRRSLVLMTSVDVIDTTAGITRAATSANDGMVTETAGTPPEVVWIAADCAFEVRIRPRSALMTTPNATEAMMIAIVDRMRLVDGFIWVDAPLLLVILMVESVAMPVWMSAWPARFQFETNEPAKCFGGLRCTVRRTQPAVEQFLPAQKRPRFGGLEGRIGAVGSSDDGAPADDEAVDEEQDDRADDRSDPSCRLFVVAEHRSEEASDERAGNAEEDRHDPPTRVASRHEELGNRAHY